VESRARRNLMRRSSDAPSLRRADRGASAVEYGLFLAGIAAVLATVLFGFGGFIHQIFEDSSQCMASYVEEGPPDC
jgi:pilus assembly protein Flp/PilA